MTNMQTKETDLFDRYLLSMYYTLCSGWGYKNEQ